MPAYERGPYLMWYRYTITNITHDHVLNVYADGTPETGADAGDVLLKNSAGTTTTFLEAANSYWDVARTILPTGALAGPVVLWRATPTADDAMIFITATSLTNPAGTNGAANLAHYQLLTMRSTNGHIMKFQFMETSNTENTSYPIAPSGVDGFTGLAAHLLSDDNVVVARDDGWPIVTMNLSNGQSKALAKKRYRNT